VIKKKPKLSRVGEEGGLKQNGKTKKTCPQKNDHVPKNAKLTVFLQKSQNLFMSNQALWY